MVDFDSYYYVKKLGLTVSNPLCYNNPIKFGVLAQLGERYAGSVEVRGSIPLRSIRTKKGNWTATHPISFFYVYGRYFLRSSLCSRFLRSTSSLKNKLILPFSMRSSLPRLTRDDSACLEMPRKTAVSSVVRKYFSRSTRAFFFSTSGSPSFYFLILLDSGVSFQVLALKSFILIRKKAILSLLRLLKWGFSFEFDY